MQRKHENSTYLYMLFVMRREKKAEAAKMRTNKLPAPAGEGRDGLCKRVVAAAKADTHTLRNLLA